MNSTIEDILEVIRRDPLPAEHASSYWQLYGSQMTVEKTGEELRLISAGCEWLGKEKFYNRFLRFLERVYYRPVTSKLSAYPRIWKAAVSLCRDLDCTPNLYVFKSAVALSYLQRHWDTNKLNPQTFAIIGDGYGFLGALLRRTRPTARLFLIDLPKMLAFQCRTHQTADPQTPMQVLSGNKEAGDAMVYFVPAFSLDKIKEAIDCGINIDSMQEMKPSSIAGYFSFLRTHRRPSSHFYCVNRETKTLPGGEVIDFKEYPWQKEDRTFLDEPCPYLRAFFSIRPVSDGPRLTGVRIPFLNMNENMWHRLVEWHGR